jgi:SAM-dependent methyltransferase
VNKWTKRFLLACRKIPLLVEARFDKYYRVPDVPVSKTIAHEAWLGHLGQLANQPGKRILEIGSREEHYPALGRQVFGNAEYVGFDYYPGKNVDVVGDAHRLGSYFDGEERFDIIFSSSCFEHFAMPWIVAVEIVGLLKLGGFVFVETHFSHSSHERPWHFFQFSDMGLRALFPPALGIECVEAGMSNPLVARFSSEADKYLRNQPVRGLYCHSQFLGKKVREVSGFDWAHLDLRDVVGDSQYPSP